MIGWVLTHTSRKAYSSKKLKKPLAKLMTGGLCGLRARLLRKAFVFFPVAGGFLCCAAAYLRNVTLCPLLLVLSLAPLQIVSNTPVHDLVADLEVVLVRVTLFAQGFSSPFHGKI